MTAILSLNIIAIVLIFLIAKESDSGGGNTTVFTYISLPIAGGISLIYLIYMFFTSRLLFKNNGNVLIALIIFAINLWEVSLLMSLSMF